MEKLKVALLAASMPNFSDAGVRLFKQYGQDLQGVSEELGFDLRVERNIISTEGKAKEVRKDIDRNGTDFVLLFHPAYILGDIVFELMKSRANFGLWAIEEPTKEGPLPLASLVCLNQNTSIAGHYFRDNRKKFKWFFGNVNHKYFKKRFRITIKALTAVKNLRDAKVAQIGKIADGFRNMYYDERSIYSNFGVDVIRGIEIEDVLAEGELIDEIHVKEEVKRIYSSSDVDVANEKIVSSIRNYLAVKRICEKNNLKAVAFSCWPKLGKMNLTGCLTISLLDSIGIPAGCEGDMLSTLSMLILHYLSDMSPAVMDLPVFDDEDESILLWHCGAAPFEMSNERGVLCRCHYRAEFAQEREFDKLGPVTDIIFPEAEVTVFRLTGESNYFYYFTGKITGEDKKSFNGSRGWVGGLRLYNQIIKPVDLMNTIFNKSIQHHFPVVFRNVGDYIEEFAYWLGLQKVERVDYRDYLSV